MKITKYPQSTFVIESEEKRILIDPGSFALEKFKKTDFEPLQAVLVSHQHFDHLNKEAVAYWYRKGIPIFGNSDVAEVLSAEDVNVNKVESQKEFEIAGFKIKPVDLPHCKMLRCNSCNEIVTGDKITIDKKCKLHLDKEPAKVNGPPNTGFVINDAFFHPGDGIELSGLKVDSAGIPITGPTINYDNAWVLAASLGAKKVIPMHYSNPSYQADPREFSKKNVSNIEVVILGDGEHVDLGL